MFRQSATRPFTTCIRTTQEVKKIIFSLSKNHICKAKLDK